MAEGATHADPGVLERLDLFAGCDRHERDRAARLLHPVVYEPGETVLEPGGDPRLVIVLAGRLRVTTPHGVEGVLGRGDLVGEIALLDGGGITAHVRAEERAEVLVAGVAAFDRLRSVGDIGRRVRALADARRDVAGRAIVAASTVPVFTRPPRVAARGAGLASRTTQRRRPVRLIVAGLGAAAAVGVGAFLVVGNSSTPVGIEQALARLEVTAPSGSVLPSSAPDGPGSTPEPAPESTATPLPEVAGSTPAPTAEQPGGAAVAPAPVASAPAATQPGGSTPPPASTSSGAPTQSNRYARPTPGVYTYATTGGESISVPNGRHDYPSETYAAVRLGQGCAWTVEHLILEEHVEFHDRCSRIGEVLSSADGRTVSFFGKSQENAYRCDPPAVLMQTGARPGSTGSATCRGEGEDRAVYRGTFVGEERRSIGGVPVVVEHVSLTVELSGGTRGSSQIELWLDARTGLLVREERSTRADVDSEIGHVRYEEDATFELVSMEPRR